MLKYLNNVWLSSDTTGHDSVPNISKYSPTDNTAEEIKSQKNVSKIPINSNLLFDSDANDKKPINTLKNARIKHPKKSLFVTYSYKLHQKQNWIVYSNLLTVLSIFLQSVRQN